MELRTLRYFLVLTQEGTISGAAKALHVTQPTLSRQLSDLEREFGKKLFERGSKRIRLTDEGVRLREYAASSWRSPTRRLPTSRTPSAQ